MKHRSAVLPLLTAIGCMAPAPRAEPPADAPPEPSPPPAASAATVASLEEPLTRSLAYLERDGSAWMHGESPLNKSNGCISCHVVGFALWSHNAAAGNGLSIDRTGIEQLTEEAMEFIGRPRKGRAVTWGQLLLGRSSPADDARYDWRAMVDGTVASQERAGHWRARGQFPTQRRPVPESDAVATMWSLLALHSIAAAEDVDPVARDRALAWLAESPDGVSGEWLAMRLLTVLRFGEREDADHLRDRLVDEQRADGGWSWLLTASPEGSTDPSNAYSTGVAVYALRQAGLPRSHPVVLAATDYLLATQRPDGAWDLPSRLISAEPSAGKDYIYEYWGTAWAVIGLSEMLQNEKLGLS